MSVDNFLDSNVFVYLFDDSDHGKQQRAASLIYNSIEEGTACISFQVVQETMNVMLRKIGVSTKETHTFFNRVLVPLWRINPTQALYRRGLDVQARYRLSFYDSLIVAAALEAGCQTLYSEDLQHAQIIEHLTIRNPFLT